MVNSKEFYEAFSKMHQDMPPVVKDSKNPHFKSSYTKLPSLFRAIESTLVKHGFFLDQSSDTSHTLEGYHGICARLVHFETGEVKEVTLFAKPQSMAPQQVGSATTYLRRYSAMVCLNLVDDDDDGNSSSLVQKSNDEDPLLKELMRVVDSKGWKREKISQLLRQSNKPEDPRELSSEDLRKLINFIKDQK